MERVNCMDIQEAYKIFGLSDNATDEEIEKQYLKWIRRSKASQSNIKTDQTIDIESINMAYNTIKTYKKYGTESPKESNNFRDKLEHFFRYYKLHTIGVIALILIITGMSQAVINNYQEKKELANLPEESVNIMFYGSYVHQNLTSNEEIEKKLAENVLIHFPSWERVITTLNYINPDVTDGTDVGLQQKSAILLATEKPDVYIMELEYFQMYVNSGMFLPIEQLDFSIDDHSIEDKLYYAKTETDTTEHLYGIEITDESIFNGVSINQEPKKIAAIRRDAKHKSNALQLILKFSKADGDS